ncbi:HNH endonuclease [Salinicola rhizosphaerae]|uniref:HNH nuclease domain-containing protein n=1 Tax=Salinicola rhizosphaerae TaxID=1443141 RepID=A0ABQ3DV26_9GAMM|nr:HNH endonuclease [Salinicola rhizosphaerae]GHB12801.1 hypothetical protein GCM10009038_08510 [Salinicola rhizosphaerae]
MARRSQRSDPHLLRQQLITLLTDFDKRLNQSDLREQVQALVPANYLLRDLGSSLIQGENLENARDRIIAYLCKYHGSLIKGDELMVVAGISEYARRIRELRVQEGWPILSGAMIRQMIDEGELGESELTSDKNLELSPDSYILLENSQDRDAAFRWNSANRIRKSEKGIKSKILEYLRLNVGEHVTGEELKYLANDKSEWPRRIRELRTEEGWPILTKVSGNPELPVGVYVLEEDKQAQPHDRNIPDSVRVDVLTRDNHKCRKCNWGYSNLIPGDPRRILELHHIIHHANRGTNTADNLITLCNVHHDQVHKNEITPEELISLINGV